MNWQEEAAQITRAFGVRDKCHFLPKFGDESTMTLAAFENQYVMPAMLNEMCLSVTYRPGVRTFTVQSMTLRERKIGMVMWLDGRVIANAQCVESKMILVKGMFNLNRLWPDVETALGYSPSAHERLEWHLELDARLKAIESK